MPRLKARLRRTRKNLLAKALMTKFSDLKLDPHVLKAISEAGYDSPTPIQQGAIPPALEGRDVLGIAQTGTGKTASFTLPMITLLGRGRARARMPRSLVLAPTRELAAQVAENFDTYAKYTKLTKALLIGGVSFGEQDKLIDRGVDVLIATPGRLLDHFERGKLLLTGVQIMVVDEADRMLDMGFIPDIERIFQLTPFTRQTLFFSATMAPEIERITDTFLHSPERIEVARQATTSETIEQRLIEITPTRRDQSAKQKRELLRALINAEGDKLSNAIIFANRKTDVDIVAKSLKAHGYDAAPIHGDLDQSQRMRTLDEFREGTLKFLIASDVAARGLDIPAVSHVFNFDLPMHAEDYVHRIGRTGRAGRQGTAISITTPADEKFLAGIENLVKQTLPRASIPEGFALSAAAQNPPRAQQNDRRSNTRGERSRSRRNGRRDEDHTPETVQVDVAEAPQPETVETRPERRSESRNEPLHDHAPVSHVDREDNRDQRRERRRESGRDGGRDHRSVLGMGDHVPEFMLRSFRPAIHANEEAERLARQTPAEPETAQQLVAEAAEAPHESAATPVIETPAVEIPIETPAAAPAKRPRRSRVRKDAAPADVAAEVSDTDPAPEAPKPVEAAAETVAEAPATEAPATEAPATETLTPEAPATETPAAKPVRKRAPRKPKVTEAETTTEVEVAAETAAEPSAEAPAEKPKRTRTRRPKVTAEASPPAEAVAEVPATTSEGGE